MYCLAELTEQVLKQGPSNIGLPLRYIIYPDTSPGLGTQEVIAYYHSAIPDGEGLGEKGRGSGYK